MPASRALAETGERRSVASSAVRVARVGAALVGAVLLASRSLAAAEPEPAVDLTWTAPAECPDSASVLVEVDRLVSSTVGERLAVDARVEREGQARYRLWIRTQGAARGVRSVSARTCESLARAAALLIAIALDRQSPDALEDDLLGPSEADAAPAPARAPLPVSPTPPAPPAFVAHARSSPRRLVLLSSGVLGERAVLPRLAFGAYLAGGVEGSALGARLQVASVPRGSVSLPAWPQVGIDFSLVRAELAGCWHGSVGPVVAASCAGLQVSSVRAIATGVDRSTPREATLMAVAPSLLLRWPRRTVVALETAFEVSAPLSRPTFSVHNLGPIYRVHPSGYSGRLGVLLRLGGRDERVAPLTPR